MKRSLILLALIGGAALAARAEATGLLLIPDRPKVTRAATAAQTKRLLGASILPSSWDSRDYGWVTPVRNQNSHGTCWTFAALATLETQLLKQGRGEYDLSEKNMANLSGFGTPPTLGGNSDMAAAYLLRANGAVEEQFDAYPGSTWKTSVEREPSIRVKEVVWIPARESVDELDTLKTAIMQYGAVDVSMHFSTTYLDNSSGAYYCPSAKDVDHAVTVVGWDDEYSTDNFKSAYKPDSPGAWLVKNSWGTSYGDKGYIHVSYYDPNFATAEPGVVFIPFDEDDDFQGVYGYDRCGYVGAITNSSYTIEAAVFTAVADEELAAVGVYSLAENIAYTVKVYTNNVHYSEERPSLAQPVSSRATAAISQSGTLSHAGFSMIELSSAIPLQAGKEFCIVYEQKVNSANHCVCFDYTMTINKTAYQYSKCTFAEGQTYLGGKSGNQYSWKDSYNSSYIVCLKAYTRAPAVKTPESGADVSAALAAFKSEYPDYALEFGGTFGAFSRIAAPNGRSLAYNWIVNGEFFKEDVEDFKIGISLTNSIPYIYYTPKRDDRTYTIYGSDDLETWSAVSDPATSGKRFFKVGIE